MKGAVSATFATARALLELRGQATTKCTLMKRIESKSNAKKTKKLVIQRDPIRRLAADSGCTTRTTATRRVARSYTGATLLASIRT
jgi:hypothetical protein